MAFAGLPIELCESCEEYHQSRVIAGKRVNMHESFGET
jgi:hypothetical protein